MKVLFVVNTMTYFSVLIDVARYLKKYSGYQPILYFTSSYPTIDRDINTCKKEGLEYVLGFSANGDLPRSRLLNFAINSNFITMLISKILKYRNDFKLIEKVISDTSPGVIILAGDNVGYNTSVFIKVGHKRNIPSIIVPLWMAGAKEAAEAYYHDRNYDCRRPSNYLVHLLFPNWVYRHKGKKMLRWPAESVIAMKLFKIDPPSPWALNSGYADTITVESKAVFDYMVKEGLPAEQIKITGSLSDDILSENMNNISEKKELLLKYGLKLDKPIILCALPPDMLYGFGRIDCEFKTYSELVGFWMSSLSAMHEYNILVSLHPSVKLEDFNYLQEKWKIKLAEEPITKLMPFCDIFVASISATIQWAIACGKPVINYDVYKYRYTDYAGVKGVLYVDNKPGFIDCLNRIGNKDFYKGMLDSQKADASKWGILDGKAGERITGVIDSLIYKYNNRAAL